MVVQETLSNNFSMVSRACLGIIASLVIMLFLSLELTGICFCGIVPLAFFTIFYQRWMRIVQKTIQAAKGKMNNVAEESFSNIRTVKAFNNEDEEIEKFQKGNSIVMKAGRKKAFYTGLYQMLQ